MDIVPLQDSRLPQDLVPVLVLLEGDEDWPRAEDVRARHDAAGGRHRDVPLDVEVTTQQGTHLRHTTSFIILNRNLTN